jgi:chromosome segregation ATPase
MADEDWESVTKELSQQIANIQNWCGQIERNTLNSNEKQIVENIDATLEICKILLSYSDSLSQALARVDTDRASLKTQVHAINNEIGSIKGRLEKLEKN